MAEINRLIASNNLKAAIELKNGFQPHFDHLRRYTRLFMVIKRFEEDFQLEIQQQSLEFLIKNIRKVFEFLPKFGVSLAFNLKNNSSVERMQNTAMLELFAQTVELLKLVGNYDKLKLVFHDKFAEYLENSILKEVDTRNFPEKAVDIFCFFVTYESFRLQVFHGEVAPISLLRTEPRFIEKMKSKVQTAAEIGTVATFIVVLSKLGNMFDAFKMSELYLVFRELIDYSLSNYIEKSIHGLTQSSKGLGTADFGSALRTEHLDRPEAYRQFISGPDPSGIPPRR